MVKANELRIGNWVNHEKYGHCTVSDLAAWDNKIGVKDPIMRAFVYMPIDVDPIPLTPEILEQCGAKKHGDWFIFKNSGLSPQYISISLIHKKTTFGNNEEYPLNHVEYLHQFQNVVFFLSGEELVYQPIKELT